MFGKVGWFVTWLTAPLAAAAAVGVPTFLALNLTGYDELALLALGGAGLFVLWICLVWGVAQFQSPRGRLIYLGGCAVIAAGSVAFSYLPLLAGPEEATVEHIQPSKAQ